MVDLQILFGKKPFGGISSQAALIEAIERGQPPASIAHHEERNTRFPVHILRRCWSREPSDRPQAKDIVEAVRCALSDRKASNGLLATRRVMNLVYCCLEFTNDTDRTILYP